MSVLTPRKRCNLVPLSITNERTRAVLLGNEDGNAPSDLGFNTVKYILILCYT